MTAAPVRVRQRSHPQSTLARGIEKLGEHGRQEPPASRRALDLQVPEAKMRVKRKAYGQEVEQEIEIDVPMFHTPPAYVRVGGSVTKNLGDYNSAKVEVSVSLPCYPTEPEITTTYLYASQLVDRMTCRELDIATGAKQPEDPF